MKKLILILTLLLALSLTACSNMPVIEDSKFNIITSFYPMYIATANIIDGAQDVSLECLASPDVGCLHDYQLTVNDMKKLEFSDLFVVNGGGMESFLDKAVSTYPNLQIVNASENIINEEHEFDEDHETKEEHEGHHHGTVNPHVWVSVSLYIDQVKNISKKLQEINPENAEVYAKNEIEYIKKLENLKNEMHEILDNVKEKDIVTFHEAFYYFAEEFNLNVVAVIEREPGTSPSAKDLVGIINQIREINVKAIFVEPQYLKTAANTIADETNVNVYELDPVVSGIFEKDAYEKIMRANLEVLKEALSNG